MTEVKPLYFRLVSLALLVVGLTWLAYLNKPQAANLTSVSVTMSNSRVSYRGRVSGTPGSDTIMDIVIDSPAITDYTVNLITEITDALKVTDSLTFTTSGARTIADVVDTNTIAIDSAIATTNETFYLAETSALEVVFDTNTDVTAGYFQVLVPATGTSATSADGIPDQAYFDFGTGSPTVSCEKTGSHTFGTPTASAGQTGGILPTGYWHVYTCPYTTGGTGGTITIGIPTIINPAPAAGHITGIADTYEVVVRNVRTSDNAVIDSTTVKIGAIEAVRVSATVVPSLTFEIIGETAGATRCGETTDITTTGSSVPFGEINTGDFKYGSQELKVTTNALSGAVVTAIANDQLGRNGEVCAGDTYNAGVDAFECIWDANVASMSHTVEQDWTVETETGFGYSIENIDSDNPAFEYNVGGTFVARHFADFESAQDPVDVFGPSTPTNSDSIYACYRIIADALTAAGDYYNYITYTATATF